MGIVELIVAAIKLAVLVLGEIFAAKKRAREAQEKFEIDQAKFLELVQYTLEKMRKDLVSDTKQSNSIDDQMDGLTNGKNN